MTTIYGRNILWLEITRSTVKSFHARYTVLIASLYNMPGMPRIWDSNDDKHKNQTRAMIDADVPNL